MVGGRNATIDRLLQDDFLDVLGCESALGNRCAHMHSEFVPFVESKHCSNHEDSARALVIVGPGPNLSPGRTRDKILELLVERGFFGIGAVYPLIAQHLAPARHTAFIAFLVIHDDASSAQCRKLSTASV